LQSTQVPTLKRRWGSTTASKTTAAPSQTSPELEDSAFAGWMLNKFRFPGVPLTASRAMSANLGISAFLVFVALSTSANGEDRVSASWYGDELRGKRTASGERFNPSGLTAAHRTLPSGTCLVVTNPRNGKSVNVRVNDRGPFVKDRVLDVAAGVARAIGMVATQIVSMRHC
jgi:rare lipoprotein A